MSSRCLGELRKTEREEVVVKTQNKSTKNNKDQVSTNISYFLFSSFFFSSFLPFSFFCLSLPSCILLLFFTSFLPSFVLSFFICTQLLQLISKMTQIKIPQSWNYHYLESDIFLWREKELSCGMFSSACGFSQQVARRIFVSLSTSWGCNKLSFSWWAKFHMVENNCYRYNVSDFFSQAFDSLSWYYLGKKMYRYKWKISNNQVYY